MQKSGRTPFWTFLAAAALLVALAPHSGAQTRPAVPVQPMPAAATAPSDQDVAATQDQLIKLLRTSPTLTDVVSRDPSLLSDQQYVSRNNPELAQFLAAHPEVVRNPEYYLFTHLDVERGDRRDEALGRKVWPDLQQQPRENFFDIVGPIAGAVAFACFLAALVWIIRQIIENRRWSRIFKLQSEVHGRLIERFGSNQELALYMGTEAGKRFLEAAPIPVGFEPEQRMPNAVARVLTPLQVGIVLILLGAGFYLLHNVDPRAEVPMRVMGTLALMPGVGFILSAGVTWVLARRLGLMPETPTNPAAPSDARDVQ